MRVVSTIIPSFDQCWCWDVETNIGTLVDNFSRFINRAVGSHPAEVTITMDGATGVGLQKSLRAIREEEKECAIGLSPSCQVGVWWE